ncbi:hypothetical protein JUJ52_08640 [Virgibacillus sp. AGTR]|nr:MULTISPECIES: hypothetical protein [unclassified Virgibacillus]MCC2250032.1 hypothetical protein [Virgibacillus sp. AGTR]QRZ17791.1 hypothetical protein JUJ52_18945 [Virgibacillus sp. AGTR]
MPTKVTYKTSEEHTKKLMLNFFKKTSIPRIIAEHQNKQEESKTPSGGR